MQWLVSSFPAYAAGAGLVLLRICVALSLLLPALARMGAAGPSSLCGVAIVVSLGLVLGTWTWIACLAAIAVQSAWASGSGTGLHLLDLIALLPAASLLLLGPGAYSIDGYRFGRRVVVIPRR